MYRVCLGWSAWEGWTKGFHFLHNKITVCYAHHVGLLPIGFLLRGVLTTKTQVVVQVLNGRSFAWLSAKLLGNIAIGVTAVHTPLSRISLRSWLWCIEADGLHLQECLGEYNSI